MVPDAFPRTALQRDVSVLDDRLLVGLVAAALPVPLSIAIGIGHGAVTGLPEPTIAGKNIMYGIASLLVIAVVYVGFSRSEWTAMVRFERPSRDELAWTALCFPLGTAAFLAGGALARAAGLSTGGFEYTLSDPITVVAVLVGSVIMVPLAEELLFRGLLLGSLLGRGMSPLLAGGTTIVAFGLIHIVLWGAGGVLAVSLWAVFPTLLRLRFNNLTGAWLLHSINNAWSYFGVVALGIA